MRDYTTLSLGIGEDFNKYLKDNNLEDLCHVVDHPDYFGWIGKKQGKFPQTREKQSLLSTWLPARGGFYVSIRENPESFIHPSRDSLDMFRVTGIPMTSMHCSVIIETNVMDNPYRPFDTERLGEIIMENISRFPNEMYLISLS